MEISNFRIPDPVVNSIGAALEVTGEVGFEKILFTAAGQDGSADRVNKRGVSASKKAFQRLRQGTQNRQSPQGPEGPLVIWAVAAIQKKNRRQRTVYELTDGKPGRGSLAVAKTALIVVLSGLRHQEKMTCQPFQTDIFREIRQCFPDSGYLARIIKKQAAVCCLGKCLLGHGQPLFGTQASVFRAGDLPEKLSRAQNAAARTSYGQLIWPLKPPKLTRQLCVSAFKQESRTAIDLILTGQKNTEARLKIVIL